MQHRPVSDDELPFSWDDAVADQMSRCWSDPTLDHQPILPSRQGTPLLHETLTKPFYMLEHQQSWWIGAQLLLENEAEAGKLLLEENTFYVFLEEEHSDQDEYYCFPGFYRKPIISVLWHGNVYMRDHWLKLTIAFPKGHIDSSPYKIVDVTESWHKAFY
jgi:hypothetical protein